MFFVLVEGSKECYILTCSRQHVKDICRDSPAILIWSNGQTYSTIITPNLYRLLSSFLASVMDICKEQRSCVSVSRESTDVISPPSPNPPTSPPLIPSSPCQPPLPLGGLGSLSHPTNNTVWNVASADARKPSATAGKDEISRGMQKLLSWRMCNERDDSVWIASNRHTAPVLQQGPECGIVALCMAVNMLGPVSADKRHIMNTAQEKGFTIQGEMFSATNLLDLVSCSCGVNGRVLVGNMTDNRDDIILHLANGWPVLVPYDKDANCEPCSLRGHKAHWAVISGFLLQCSRADFPDLNSKEIHQDPAASNLYCISVDNHDGLSEHTIQTVQAVLQSLPASDVYLLARQGKSTHIHPWRYTALSDSNSNLLELGSSIQADIGKFVIPEGGIQAGLCSQVVLIRP
ncbi:UPF0692 protein C19orf54 homolog isoform X1 [Patiria miniata]|uniref:Actin maturation protease n=2 Tax=Patiria miniata TaxID=46514 RepID=A0A913Z633_PATMI|nr:UPF0692 protein C19orf54 homolog isoform X1 [Patiria miniata]